MLEGARVFQLLFGFGPDMGLRQEFRHSRSQASAGDLVRDLADYDRAFGLITSVGEAGR